MATDAHDDRPDGPDPLASVPARYLSAAGLAERILRRLRRFYREQGECRRAITDIHGICLEALPPEKRGEDGD
jgi:hypothetical protein